MRRITVNVPTKGNNEDPLAVLRHPCSRVDHLVSDVVAELVQGVPMIAKCAHVVPKEILHVLEEQHRCLGQPSQSDDLVENVPCVSSRNP